MKIFRRILTSILILAILGTSGYLIWNYSNVNEMLHSVMPNMKNTNNMNDNNMDNMNGMNNMHNKQQDQKSAGNMSGSMTATKPLNVLAAENKDKLTKIISTINDAINQITIDPYSRVTLPGTVTPNTNTQQPQGNTTVNIYPNANNTPSNTPGQPAANTNVSAGNYVYDQVKLEKLHNGIFKLSQGMMLLSGLNDDLTMQASNAESGSNYEIYVLRYNVALQNKIKLSTALNMINDGSALINVNPYASSAGYQYNTQSMQQLHNGIYKLAQGMLEGSKLNEEFTNEMAQASVMVNNSNSMMNMNTTSRFGNLTSIFSTILIIMIVGLFIGLFGSMMRILRSKD